MSVLVTRHGETAWNTEHRVQGKANTELNQTGIDQAIEIARKLQNEDIDLIISSPLLRAIQTAEIINAFRDVPIILEERLSERNFGILEGRKLNEFDVEEFWDYSQNIRYKDAERVQDFFGRVFQFMDEAKEKYRDENILLVCHSGTSIPLNCYFKGIPKQFDLKKMILGNCQYVKYEFQRTPTKEQFGTKKQEEDYER